MASSLSIKPFLTSLPSDLNDQGLTPGNFPASLGLKKSTTVKGSSSLLMKKKFELNCLGDREMDVSTSAMVDGIAECSNEMEAKEPSISTILMNFENKFDPYGALSTPLYQTATFKQPSATENGPYDYTRSGNPTRDALESLLAKLDKADRAFCFTSGMAALAAVTHLVGTDLRYRTLYELEILTLMAGLKPFLPRARRRTLVKDGVESERDEWSKRLRSDLDLIEELCLGYLVNTSSEGGSNGGTSSGIERYG